MNVKFLILNCFCVVFLFGYEANSVTGAELEQLKVIDKKIYELSVREIDYSFEKIAFFIFRNLSYDLDYVRLKISSSANIRTNSTGLAFYNPKNAAEMLKSMKNKAVSREDKILARREYERKQSIN